ncbi:MAG: site-specific DNA-methyltransferase [Clostridia bacterium]|nr:site-specific DNA-methyltransferase [Clostridia bacterium]
MPELLHHIYCEIMRGEGESRLYIDDAAERMEKLCAIMPGSVSLIYMDPPFRTGKEFEIKLRRPTGGQRSGEAEISLPAYSNKLTRKEYFALMRRVLEASKKLLTGDGMLFLHVDYREHANLRLLADEIFGEENLINEIIWAYESGGRSKNFFARKHDIILLYAATKEYDLHIEDAAALMAGDKKNHMARGVDEDGRSYRYITSGGKTYRYYDDEPVPPSDVWTDISHLQQRDPQRTGYETQKPLKLLDRIVKCASRPGDTVLDPFCGSGTTLEAAYLNGRQFIGIDLNPAVVEFVRKRTLGSGAKLYFSESEGAPSISVERVPGITFEAVYLTDVQLDGLPEGLEISGIDDIDSWAVGTVSDGVFTCLDEEVRTAKNPILKGELHMEMYQSALAVRISDILGRSYFFSL